MSILKKPYEISVWEDRWDARLGKFVERKLGIIGTHLMTSQNRAMSRTSLVTPTAQKNSLFSCIDTIET